jgi:hypothetical protein
MRRAVAVLAEDRQKVPVQSDIIEPSIVRRALQGGDSAANMKTGEFSGTFKHIAGFDDKAPNSTNDRQVASLHGVEANMFRTPWFYEAMSRFYLKLRDELNAADPEPAKKC